jgi:hypothetical protein
VLSVEYFVVCREVLSAFRSSALALKQLLADDGSADAAAETMDELQQVTQTCCVHLFFTISFFSKRGSG